MQKIVTSFNYQNKSAGKKVVLIVALVKLKQHWYLGTMFTASSNVVAFTLLGGANNPGACKAVRTFYVHLNFTVFVLYMTTRMVMEEKTKIGVTKSKKSG